MKRYTDYTQDELANLTDEELTGLVDLECAINGVPLLPEKPEEPQRVASGPSTPVYKVPEQEFLSFADAEAVREFILGRASRVDTRYNWGKSKSYYVIKKEVPELSVQTQQAYTAEEFDRLETVLAAEDRAAKEHDERESEYKRIKSLRQEADETVRQAVTEAIRFVNKRERYKAAGERYKRLAGGDEEQAKVFMIEAYPDAPSVLTDWEWSEALKQRAEVKRAELEDAAE